MGTDSQAAPQRAIPRPSVSQHQIRVGVLNYVLVTAIVATAAVLLVRGIPTITRYLRIRRM